MPVQSISLSSRHGFLLYLLSSLFDPTAPSKTKKINFKCCLREAVAFVLSLSALTPLDESDFIISQPCYRNDTSKREKIYIFFAQNQLFQAAVA